MSFDRTRPPESRGHPRGLGGLDLEPQCGGWGGAAVRGSDNSTYETARSGTVIAITKTVIFAMPHKRPKIGLSGAGSLMGRPLF